MEFLLKQRLIWFNNSVFEGGFEHFSFVFVPLSYPQNLW